MRRFVGYALLTLAAAAFAVMVQWRAFTGPSQSEGVPAVPPEQFPPAAHQCWESGGVWHVNGGDDVKDGRCEPNPGPIVPWDQVGTK